MALQRLVLESLPSLPTNPAPVPLIGVNYSSSGVASVTATLSAVGATSATFMPLAGRAFAIAGDGNGTVQLLKKVPGDPLFRATTAAGTVLNLFSGPFAEEWVTDITGTLFQFQMTAAGTMNVRFDQ